MTQMAENTRVIHTDVKMRAIETTVEGGLIRREWFLIGSPDVLKTGEKIFVKTRKPWPAHVSVGAQVTEVPTGLKLDKGMVCVGFDFVPRDNTRRENSEVRISQG